MVKMTYTMSRDAWEVWFVPEAGMWKLLGTFASWEEADAFLNEVK
jgi:hypothetical protein